MPHDVKTPRAAVQITDFLGLINNQDSRDIPPGAADEQVNAMCVKASELQVRGGLRQVIFDSG